MNIDKKIININNFKGDSLGIKVILATDTRTNYMFVIIIDVNPASCFYSEGLEIGDVLLTINGTDINSSNNLNNICQLIGSETNLEVTIIKKGALDGTDLIQRCIDSPCSELCGTWNKSIVKFKKATVNENIMPIKENRAFTLKAAKVSSVDESNIRKTSMGSSEESFLSERTGVSNNLKNISYQKALPMKKRIKAHNDLSAGKITYKSSKTLESDMIPCPQPQFIKRPSARMYTNQDTFLSLKPSKSLNYEFDDSSSSQSSETVSTSSGSPAASFKKPTIIKEQIPYKPQPMPRKKKMEMFNQNSLEPLEFTSLRVPKSDGYLSQGTGSKHTLTNADKLILDLKEEQRKNQLKSKNNTISAIFFPAKNPILPNRSPKDGTDS